MAFAKDLTGQKFGRLIVLERRGKDKHRNALWLCKCQCGNEKEIKTICLKNGDTKSCGCLNLERIQEMGRNNWAGHEEINGHYWSEIRKSARERNLDFNIDMETAWNIFLSQNKQCALSGQKLFFAKSHQKNVQTASLDRINSNLGYSTDNIQWLHKDINISKSTLEQNEFIDLCDKVIFFSENKKPKYTDEIRLKKQEKLQRYYRFNHHEILPKRCFPNDIIGKKFGRYTILEKINKKYLCLCECGAKKEVYFSHLKNNEIVSCGCYFKEMDQNQYSQWKGFGEISGSYWYSIMNGAKRRNINFELTLKSTWDQFIKQDHRCALTGEKIYFARNYKRKSLQQTASLDRINSNLGYQIDNIQWIHKKINTIKRDYEEKHFLQICRMVANHNKQTTEKIRSLLKLKYLNYQLKTISAYGNRRAKCALTAVTE
jgi:hypothetical protein